MVRERRLIDIGRSTFPGPLGGLIYCISVRDEDMDTAVGLASVHVPNIDPDPNNANGEPIAELVGFCYTADVNNAASGGIFTIEAGDSADQGQKALEGPALIFQGNATGVASSTFAFQLSGGTYESGAVWRTTGRDLDNIDHVRGNTWDTSDAWKPGGAATVWPVITPNSKVYADEPFIYVDWTASETGHAFVDFHFFLIAPNHIHRSPGDD